MMKKYSKKLIYDVVKYTQIAYHDFEVPEVLDEKTNPQLYSKIEKLCCSETYSIIDENVHCVLYFLLLDFEHRIRDVVKIRAEEDKQKTRDGKSLNESIDLAKIIADNAKIKAIKFVIDKGPYKPETCIVTSDYLISMIVDRVSEGFLEYVIPEDGISLDPYTLPFAERVEQEGMENIFKEHSANKVSHKNTAQEYHRELHRMSNLIFCYISEQKVLSSKTDSLAKKRDFIIDLYRIISLKTSIREDEVSSKRIIKTNLELVDINTFDKNQNDIFKKQVVAWIKLGAEKHKKFYDATEELMQCYKL